MRKDSSAGTPLRRGWTTGACATAATKAALHALLGGEFPDPVSVTLPGGQTPAFALGFQQCGDSWASAGIVKDAGDDPDVTHGALIMARVRVSLLGSGIVLRAGEGVGMVTRPGLPVAVGQPAINPVPRAMIEAAIRQTAASYHVAADIDVELSIPHGAQLALKTWNPRLGIEGGLSILGTTGIVVPYSCAAWIHSIHRGIDVARAIGLGHVAACTGSTSEGVVQSIYDLDYGALLDMGDFAGGLLKYLRRHPLPRLTICGGFGKLSKLARGFLDLHSGRSQVDIPWLAEQLGAVGGDAEQVAAARTANSGARVLQIAQSLPLGDRVAGMARERALEQLRSCGTEVEVIIVDRLGNVVGRAPGW